MSKLFIFNIKFKSKSLFIITFTLFVLFLIYSMYYYFLNQFGIGIVYIIVYTYLFVLLSISFLFLGLMQMSFDVWDDKCVSLFTPLHIVFPTLFYLLFYLIFNNNALSLLLSIGIPIFWEIIEIWIKQIGMVKENKWLINFAKESIINKLLDILFGLFGVILGFFLLGF